MYSLISTSKNAGIEPRIWMEDVLTKIPYYLRDGKDLSELLHRRWAELGTNSVESGSLVPNRNESYKITTRVSPEAYFAYCALLNDVRYGKLLKKNLRYRRAEWSAMKCVIESGDDKVQIKY